MQPHRLPLRPQPHCSFAPSCAVSPFLAHLPPSALLDSSDSSSLTYAALASVALMASSHLALSALACSPSVPQQLRPSYPLAQPVQHHPPLVWPQQHAALVSPSRMLPARVHTRELRHQFRECFRDIPKLLHVRTRRSISTPDNPHTTFRHAFRSAITTVTTASKAHNRTQWYE